MTAMNDLVRYTSGFCIMLAVLASGVAAGTEPEPAPAPGKPTWDRVANIKDAAARIGRLQKAKGVDAAYKFIDACYRTLSLAEKFSAGFEACIAQDYLQTKMLVEIYQRTPPQVLQKFKTPTPEVLATTMGRRISGAFAQYKITAVEANAFKDLVDKHGLPVFVAIVFPDAIRELNARKPQQQPAKNPKPVQGQ